MLICEQRHDAFEETDQARAGLDKLKPYFGPGTGAFYVEFKRDVGKTSTD